MSKATSGITLERGGFSADAGRSWTLDALYYRDLELYALEQERVFARNWLLVCHQTEIAGPGDFRRFRAAGEEIFVIRGRDGVVRAFYNVCRHRASLLIDEAAGNRRAVISCPYHSWTYDLEGKLRVAQNSENVEGFCKSDFSLSPVRVETFLGFVYVNLDDDAPAMADRLGELEAWMRCECPGIDDYKLVYRSDNEVSCNWKTLVENLIESYHLALSGPAHRTFTEAVACGDAADAEPYTVRTHNMWSSHVGPAGPKQNAAYCWETERALGGGNGFATFHVFPDWAFLLWPGADVINVFVNAPAGPEKTAQYFAYYGPSEDVDEETRGLMHYFSHVLGPEDNELCSRVQQGLRSRSYRQGRLMVDRERTPLSEHAVHHFQAQVLAAMEG